jgi:cytochrome c-type biogenesis protein
VNAPLALALTAGMVGAINPCGFSLLPAYIAFFVTGEAATASLDRRVLRALAASAAVTTGFVVVFVTLGFILKSLADRIRPDLPWVTLSIGILVVIAGIAVTAGRRLPAPAFASRAMSGGNPAAMFTYGVVYALASLSCTIGPFIAITTVALNRSIIGGVATYIAYALGMGTIILILAVAAVFARPEPTRQLRHASRYASRIGGLLMIITGSYAIWYARWELAVYRGDLTNDPIVDAGERLRLDFVQFIETVGAVRLAAAVALAVVMATMTTRARQQSMAAKLETPMIRTMGGIGGGEHHASHGCEHDPTPQEHPDAQTLSPDAVAERPST